MTKTERTWTLATKIAKSKEITRILYYGKPGTGKTTAANRAENGHGVYNITLHDESSVAELIGHWVPVQGGGFKWHDGIAIKAWKEGAVLVVNEIDKAGGAVKTILMAIMDDPEIASLSLPNGETVKPSDGFKIIATMNGNPVDLPIALLDRFDAVFEITMPNPEVLKRLPKALREMVENEYKSATGDKNPNITVRDALAYLKLREVLPDKEALLVAFGNMASDVESVMKLVETAKTETEKETA